MDDVIVEILNSVVAQICDQPFDVSEMSQLMDEISRQSPEIIKDEFMPNDTSVNLSQRVSFSVMSVDASVKTSQNFFQITYEERSVQTSQNQCVNFENKNYAELTVPVTTFDQVVPEWDELSRMQQTRKLKIRRVGLSKHVKPNTLHLRKYQSRDT